MSLFDCRHVLAYVGFLGVANLYLCRINLSMAVVAMIGSKNALAKRSNGSAICADLANGDDNPDVGAAEEGEFDWDEGVRGDLLGSYFYGYIWTQIPGGWLAYKFGFKKVY